MYIPTHFAADDAAVRDLLVKHGAADLITLTADGLVATMLPFAYEPAVGQLGALYGHVARNNDQWSRPALGQSLAIVRGPHVYGQLVVHDDPGWVEDIVRRLTAKHETARLTAPGQPPRWSVDDAPRKF